MSNADFEITDEVLERMTNLAYGAAHFLYQGPKPIFAVPGMDTLTGDPVTLVMRVIDEGRSTPVAVLLPKFNPRDPLRYRPVSIHEQATQS